MDTDTKVDKDKIIQLWRDPDFEGSYTGIKTFQTLLKLNKDIDISEKKLYEILKNDSIFVMHIRSKKTIQRRFYNLSYYCELVQSDLAFMFEYEDFKYFIVVIDCFSGKLFAEPLKDKTSETVKNSLKRLINEFHAPITKFESDQGTEYSKFKTYCKENNIIFKYKYGANKANFAENIIQIIKRRLYKMLRGTLSRDWPKALERVVTNYNDTPLKKIGFLKPNDISSKYDSKKVRDALKSQNQQLRDEPNYSELRKNQEQFSNAKGEKLHLGDYVYVNFPESKFGKSFDFQVQYLRATFSFFSKVPLTLQD
jgi:hypothetical protein